MPSSDRLYDVIVIGSGPTAVHAAWPLIEAGLSVAIIDGGNRPDESIEGEFTEDFFGVRQRSDQFKLFLGSDLSGVAAANSEDYSQAIGFGARSYIVEDTKRQLPIKPTSTHLIQTLARGGLAEAWGGACAIFNQSELRSVGIPESAMAQHYQLIIDRIGVSGPDSQFDTQPPLELDSNAVQIQKRDKGYKQRSDRFTLHQPLLAVLSRKKGDREAISYRDLEFWLNDQKSIYRATFTLEELQRQENCVYWPSWVATLVKEMSSETVVVAKALHGQPLEREFRAKRVVLACGAINSTRLLLKSFNLYERKVPFLTKKHIVIPCLNIATLGRGDERRRHSLCQLVIEDQLEQSGLGGSFTQLYSYRSLLYTKLLNHSPLPTPETLSLLGLFGPSIVLADVRVPSFEHAGKYALLSRSSDNKLVVEQSESISERSHREETVKAIVRYLKSLGLLPLRAVEMPFGSTAHYAGGAPRVEHADSKELLLSTDFEGRLVQSRRIYLADGTTWRVLPAKPPTLTMMADANRVGTLLAKKLRP